MLRRSLAMLLLSAAPRVPILLGTAEAAPLCLPASPLQQVLGWLKQRVPQEEQAALAAALRQVVADKLLQQLLLAWLSPDGSNSSSNGAAKASKGGAAVDLVAVAGGVAAAAAVGDAEPMAVDGCCERQQQGAAPPPTVQQQQLQQTAGGCEEFVCCRAGAGGGEAQPCSGGKAGGAANGCRYDRDLEEAGITPGSKPPLRVRGGEGDGRLGAGGREMGGGVPAAGRALLCFAWQRRLPCGLEYNQGGRCAWAPCCSAHPLHQPQPPPSSAAANAQEIYYFHQAIRSALHSFAAEARALRAAEGRVTTAQVRLGRNPWGVLARASAPWDVLVERSSNKWA